MKENLFVRGVKGVGKFLLLFLTHYATSGLTLLILFLLIQLLAPTFIGKIIFGILNIDAQTVTGAGYSFFGGMCTFSAFFSYYSVSAIAEKLSAYKQTLVLGIWITITEITATIMSIATNGFSSLLLDKLAFLVLGIAFICSSSQKKHPTH